jgi:hypothetical protein
MRKMFFKTLIVLAGIFFVQQSFAQQQLTGRITDGNGEPIPGVNIRIKGTQKGTITDLDGIYKIEVFMEDVLVISFVGMRTREVTITPQSFAQLSYKKGKVLNTKKRRELETPIPLYYEDPENTFVHDESNMPGKNEKGVAVLGEKENRLKKYRGKRSDYGASVLRKIEYNDSLRIYTFSFEKPYSQKVERFEFNSGFSFDKVTKLPDFQSVYSSGVTQNGEFVYTSPLENNFLTWGPALSSLEYDGQSSGFYGAGNIVTKGTGNGTSLSTYHPESFFTTGYRFNNSLEYRITKSERYFYAKYNYLNNKGVFPGAKLQGHDFTLGAKTNRFDARAFLSYKKGENSLYGGNYSRILHGLYTTPPEFDNANGIESKKAYENAGAYLINGNQRSYSSNLLENPYWLIAFDPTSSESLNYGVNASYNNHFGDDWRYDISTALQKLENQTNSGYVSFFQPENSLGIEETKTNFEINSLVKLQKRLYVGRLFYMTSYVKYLFKHSKNDFTKETESLGYIVQPSMVNGELLNHFSQINNRTTHEIMIGQYNESSYIDFPVLYSASLNIYESSTSDQTYFLPSASVGLALYDIGGRFSDLFPGKVYFAYAKSIEEVDYDNHSSHYNTVNYDAGDFRNYLEVNNTFFNDLKPLKTTSYTAGLSFWNLANIGIELFADFYYKKTDDAFFPTLNNGDILIKNLANISNKGFEAGISYGKYRYRFNYKIDVNFTKSRNTVDELLTNDEVIPIAGFNDVHKSLIEGEEVGVIVGSKYLRNNEGLLIIGMDGYPLVDPNPGIIGNPNPDWTLNINNKIGWKWFDLAFNFEYKHGGQVWNGTKNVMNFHGVTPQAADSRNITNYVFDGVNVNGQPNNVAVDFANPSDNINEFRYLRYGYTGVAEDAIEDATWFRLKKIALSFKIGHNNRLPINISGLKLGLLGRKCIYHYPVFGSRSSKRSFWLCRSSGA